MKGSSVYIVERCGSYRFSIPEIVDVYESKSDAMSFAKGKNDTNKSSYKYSVRVKRIK